jgi:hypothetical protein
LPLRQQKAALNEARPPSRLAPYGLWRGAHAPWRTFMLVIVPLWLAALIVLMLALIVAAYS